MAKISDTGAVRDQYASGDGLTIRKALHERYSTNPQDFAERVFERYAFPSPGRVLELGCGTGDFWTGRIDRLPADVMLTLSDFSEGMVHAVWGKYARYPHVMALRVDIQDIPFPDGAFDAVIANQMLYHVPDLSRAMLEVRRVLKPGGAFYCTTNGNGGMNAYLNAAIRDFDPSIDAYRQRFSFSLQNGADILGERFTAVELIAFEDALRITDTRDLIAWIESMIPMNDVPAEALGGLYDYFEAIRRKKGAIDIPKESGLFIVRK